MENNIEITLLALSIYILIVVVIGKFAFWIVGLEYGWRQLVAVLVFGFVMNVFKEILG